MNTQHCGWDLGRLATSNYAASLCHTQLFISVSILISSLLDWNHLHPFGNLEKNVLRERYPCPTRLADQTRGSIKHYFVEGYWCRKDRLNSHFKLHDFMTWRRWHLIIQGISGDRETSRFWQNKLSKFGKYPHKNSLGCLCYWIKFQIFFLNNYKLLNLATKSIAENLKNRNS